MANVKRLFISGFPGKESIDVDVNIEFKPEEFSQFTNGTLRLEITMPPGSTVPEVKSIRK